MSQKGKAAVYNRALGVWECPDCGATVQFHKDRPPHCAGCMRPISWPESRP